jgi:hypothetical protein
MSADASTLVVVQRDWDGWRTAQVKFGDLEDIHWFQPSRAPRPLIHAYVSCASIVSGELPHDCRQTPAPHRLLVCVLKSHTAPWIHAELTARADNRALGNGLPNGAPGFTPRGRLITTPFTAPGGTA